MSPQNIWKAIGKQTSYNSSTVEMLSQRIVEFLGCSSNSHNDILQCMKSKPLTDIMALNTVSFIFYFTLSENIYCFLLYFLFYEKMFLLGYVNHSDAMFFLF